MIIVFLLWWMLKHDPLDPFVHLLAPGGCFQVSGSSIAELMRHTNER